MSRTVLTLFAMLSASIAGASIDSIRQADVDKAKRSWTFKQLLHAPSVEEIRAVNREWGRKRWAVKDVKLTGTTTVPVGTEQVEARLYSYNLNGSQRCGVVVHHPAASPKSLAGIVDIADIRWDYPDRNLTNGPYLAKILGDSARQFAIIVPCARGMGVQVGNMRVQAAGDRRDAWEGVAEDAIGFLTAALSVTPQIDPRKLAVYGYSRGGGVALIVGQRDARVKAVLAFAAPTDWFTAMGRPGQNWAERLEAASREQSLPPDTRESQFLDWFVRDREHLPLVELRRKLLASSPLYFTDKLPPTEIHHGEQDGPVPVRNALLVRDRLSSQDASRRVFIYPGTGHSLDNTPALTRARTFLRERLMLASK